MSEFVISANNLSKKFGAFTALQGASFSIPKGRIVGLIGANGAGKTTLLNAILGLSSCDGDLTVLGLDPKKDRDALMQDVCFIADVATLPKWMKVSDVLDYVEGVHPKFNRSTAEAYLARTTVPMNRKVKALSKGMTVQVHLAVVMSIDAKLLVLDEPTLGLDIIFRKNFYSDLLEEYFDGERTILITTHNVEEIEHILSDVLFIRDGQIVLDEEMETLSNSFVELMCDRGKEAEAIALGPIAQGASFGKKTFVYKDVERDSLKALGETRRLGLADIFVATVGSGKE